ncbi:Smr/MutS family protein [Ruegeria arenilitoris]|uniref:Smr/MutS family protein n=1 Tax=Ruegeria arenilitoris TaxID=1173585 RepID=UPI00147FF53E|nr:Smr/MutS family protein [Ruegeria arenilitoris]
MSRRKLTADEIELWRKVAKQAERLHPELPQTVHPTVLPKPKPTKSPVPRLETFELGQKSQPTPAGNNLKTSISEELRRDGVRMDVKAFGRMKRGKLKPEGRLDLHGMRMDTAHPVLVKFILSAQASGKRLVLVITGKGKDRDEPGPIPTPRGVLRNQVPHWLSLPPLAQAVLQVTPAHISHGGDGAYYVYLRRIR